MSASAKRILKVVLGIGLAAVVIGEVAVRVHVEREYQAALAMRQRLERRLADLQAERAELAKTLAVEQQRVAGLAEELSVKDQELQRVLARLSQEEQTITALQRRLVAMQRQFDLVQGELALALQPRGGDASAVAGRQAVQLEKVVVTRPTASLAAQGRVLSVHPDWKFVVFDLGWDAVSIGDVVSIYRRDQLLAKARVERVQEAAAAATLLPEWERSAIEVNDVVTAF